MKHAIEYECRVMSPIQTQASPSSYQCHVMSLVVPRLLLKLSPMLCPLQMEFDVVESWALTTRFEWPFVSPTQVVSHLQFGTHSKTVLQYIDINGDGEGHGDGDGARFV